MRVFQVAGAIGLGLASMTAAHAAPLAFTGTTTPLASNITVDLFNGSSFGDTVGTGFQMDDGVQSFIAWCFDLEHTIWPGQNYDYNSTNNPYATSTLAPGATLRAQALFDANYGGVDAFDVVQAAAFQMALWEIGYDSDFDITTGVFQASGNGSNAAAIEVAASGYLAAAAGYAGPQLFNVDYLQDNSRNAGLFPHLPDDYVFQNLVTAYPVPIPAAAPLLVAAIGALAMIRSRRKPA